jgi:hypothetical protein
MSYTFEVGSAIWPRQPHATRREDPERQRTGTTRTVVRAGTRGERNTTESSRPTSASPSQ